MPVWHPIAHGRYGLREMRGQYRCLRQYSALLLLRPFPQQRLLF